MWHYLPLSVACEPQGIVGMHDWRHELRQRLRLEPIQCLLIRVHCCWHRSSSDHFARYFMSPGSRLARYGVNAAKLVDAGVMGSGHPGLGPLRRRSLR